MKDKIENLNKIKIFLIFLLLCLAEVAVAKNDTTKWVCIKNKLKMVYVTKDKSVEKELIKLYDNNKYEYLSYTRIKNKSFVKRDVGEYKMFNTFLKLNKPKRSQINSSLYKSIYFLDPKKNLCLNLFHLITGKKVRLVKEIKGEYCLPFYIDPDTKKIVNNKDSEYKIDLTELVNELTKNANTEGEKLNLIEDFIINSIDYDHNFKKRDYKKTEEFTKEVLAGKYRYAVCIGYSTILKELCDRAGIKCRVVIGAAKNDISDIDIVINSNHAWNIVTIDGIEQIHDVTFADGAGKNWLNVKPEISIYSHFPDNSNDQLLEKKIAKSQFDNWPVVFPCKTNQISRFNFDVGTVFCDSIFKWEISSEERNIEVIEYNDKIFNTVYNEENNSKELLFASKNIDKTKIARCNGKTTVVVPLRKIINSIVIKCDGFQVAYRVVKGNRNDLYKFYIKQNTNYIQQYIKAMLACISLYDSKSLSNLVGVDNSLFFDSKGLIKSSDPVINDLRKWDGKLSLWQRETILENNDGSKSSIVVDKVLIGKREILFTKTKIGYKILAIH